MTWLDAGSYFDQRARRLELEEVNRKAERLAAVRRRATLEYGPQPSDDEVELDLGAHILRILEADDNRLRRYRAWCSCGWHSRVGKSTRALAEMTWKGHTRWVAEQAAKALPSVREILGR